MTLTHGSFALDPSFNRGGDKIVVDEPATDFTAVRFGSDVRLDGSDTDIIIPIGTAGTTIHFANGDQILRFDTDLNAVLLSTQTITFNAAPLPFA